MRRSRILVTGGAGYIGSHACRALAARGYEPVTYDNLSRGNRWAVKWGPLEEGEIADGAHQRAVLDRHQPVAVMHFAAFAYVGESVEQPLLYYPVVSHLVAATNGILYKRHPIRTATVTLVDLNGSRECRLVAFHRHPAATAQACRKR
jgi:UDP-glucose 4-epimerase